MTCQDPSADAATHAAGECLTIDVREAFRSKAPKAAAFVPGALIGLLARIIRQDRLNLLLRNNGGLEGTRFCRGVLDDLNVTYRVDNPSLLPDPQSAPLYVSNHPLGALDGLVLALMIASHHGREPLVVVNDLLMAVRPLRSIFIPVNKHGAQSRGGSGALDEAFAGDRPILAFPAGLVSRRDSAGKVADLPWRKAVFAKALQSHRQVVPLFFHGRNSSFFYNFAQWRQRLRIAFNVEMMLLPGEIFHACGRCFTISVGRPFDAGGMGGSPAEAAGRVRKAADALGRRPVDSSTH